MIILSIVLRQKDREFSKPQRIKLTNCLIVLMPVETKARKCWVLDYIRSLWRLMSYMFVIFVSPLLGAWLSNKPLSPYLEFPPIPEKIQSLGFSWGVFWLITAFSIMALKPFLTGILLSNSRLFSEKPVQYRFPFLD